MEALERHVANSRYCSHVSGPKGKERFTIEIVDNSEPARPKSSTTQQERSESWWTPFPSLIMRIALAIPVLGTIAALLQHSQRSTGLGDVDRDGYLHLLWTVLPALTMVLFSILSTFMDSSTRYLAPYAVLKRVVGSIFERSINLVFLDKLKSG